MGRARRTAIGALRGRPRLCRPRVPSIVGWMAIGALVILIAVHRPPLLGGRTSYVFVGGVSMEPTLRGGDLAIVEPAPRYAVGQIVAYHPAQAPERTIVHRIVGGDAAGFVVRGDNRTTADYDRPRASDLLGRSVVIVPLAGWVLALIRSPLGMAAIAVSALALLLPRTGRRWPGPSRRARPSDRSAPGPRRPFRREADRRAPMRGSRGRS